MVATQPREVQWNELQRDPKGVAALAEQGDVKVKRRDGADLLLIRADRVAASEEGSLTAARALRNILAHADRKLIADALLDEFPWIMTLPDEALPEFVTEFVRAAQASAELGRWSVLTRTIQEWKATAQVYADPELAEKLTSPIDGDLGPARSPVGEE
jgi:hypothetical protein